jgi:hypothetical protein
MPSREILASLPPILPPASGAACLGSRCAGPLFGPTFSLTVCVWLPPYPVHIIAGSHPSTATPVTEMSRAHLGSGATALPGQPDRYLLPVLWGRIHGFAPPSVF